MLHQAAGDWAPAGVEGRAVVGQQALGHAPGGYALVEDVDGRLTGLARGDQGGHRQAGVVVLEPARSPPLRPPARTYSVASSCQQALGAGQVEPAPRRPRSLGRFGPGHPLLTEDPGQGRRRGRLEAHGGRRLQLLVDLGLGYLALGETTTALSGGGADGGRVVATGAPPQVVAAESSMTGRYLAARGATLAP